MAVDSERHVPPIPCFAEKRKIDNPITDLTMLNASSMNFSGVGSATQDGMDKRLESFSDNCHTVQTVGTARPGPI